MSTSAMEAPVRQPMPFITTGPCWVCGGTDKVRVWSDPFDLSPYPRFGPYAHAEHPPTWVVRCRQCGFGQPESLPAAADFFEMLYAIDWTTETLDREFRCGYKDAIFRNVLAGLERRLAAGLTRTVLDVGTHVGRFVYLAQQAGWQAEGAEFSALTAAYAAQRTGAPIHQGPAQALAARGLRYSAVTLNDVLEHIPRPAPVLADLRNLLHPGGVIAVKVPAGPAQRLKERIRRSLLRRADSGVGVRLVHVNHFTPSSLRRCLEGAGFRAVTIEVAAPDYMPASFAERTGGEAVAALLRLAVYQAARWIPGAIHTPLALNLQAYAVNSVEGNSPH
jgi:SAM-dependent methyltransferase